MCGSNVAREYGVCVTSYDGTFDSAISNVRCIFLSVFPSLFGFALEGEFFIWSCSNYASLCGKMVHMKMDILEN